MAGAEEDGHGGRSSRDIPFLARPAEAPEEPGALQVARSESGSALSAVRSGGTDAEDESSRRSLSAATAPAAPAPAPGGRQSQAGARGAFEIQEPAQVRRRRQAAPRPSRLVMALAALFVIAAYGCWHFKAEANRAEGELERVRQTKKRSESDEDTRLKANNAALQKREQDLQQAVQQLESELNVFSTARRSHLQRQLEMCKRFKDAPQGHLWLAESNRQTSRIIEPSIETREWQGGWHRKESFETSDAPRAEQLWARAEWTCRLKAVEREAGRSKVLAAPPRSDARAGDEWRPLLAVPLKSRLQSLKAMIKWRDQGSGNSKGAVRAVLVRRGAVLGEKDLYGPAPRGEDAEKKVDSAKIRDFDGEAPVAGDTVDFQYRVGGGGGHAIHIDHFNVEYWLDVEPACHWWYWRDWRTWVPYSEEQVEAIEEARMANGKEVDLDDYSKLVFAWPKGLEVGRAFQVRKTSEAGDAQPREARRLPVFWDTAQRPLGTTFRSVDFDELCALDGSPDGDLRMAPNEYDVGQIDHETQCAEMHKVVHDKTKSYICEKVQNEDLPVLAPVQGPEEAHLEEMVAALEEIRAEQKHDLENKEAALKQLQVQVNTLSSARRGHLREQLEVCRESTHLAPASSWVATRAPKTSLLAGGVEGIGLVESREWRDEVLTYEGFKEKFPRGEPEALWEAAAWTCSIVRSSKEVGTGFEASAEPVHDFHLGDEMRQFLTLEPLKGDLNVLTVLSTWTDQGAGNNKGVIHVTLSRHGAKVTGEDLFRPSSSHPDLGYAPRDEEAGRKHAAELTKIGGRKPARGDVIAFQYRVGGGGGHALHIDAFEVEYSVEQEPTCHWWYWQSWRTWVPYSTEQVQAIEAGLKAGSEEADLDEDSKVVFAWQDGPHRPHQVPKREGGDAQPREVRRLPIYWDIAAAPAAGTLRSVGFDELCALDGGSGEQLRLTAREYATGTLDRAHQCASMQQAQKDIGKEGYHLCESAEGEDLPVLVPLLEGDGHEAEAAE